MKKCIGLCLLLSFLLLAAASMAESAFTLDSTAVVNGMSRSYEQGYTPTISDNVMMLIVPVQAPQADGKITAALQMQHPAQSPFKGNPSPVTTYSGNSLYGVKLELPLLRDRMNGDYPAMLHLTGTTAKGDSLTGDIPLMIRIRDGQPNTEIHAPRLEDVQAALVVGEKGTITATVKNDNATLCMTDMWFNMQDSRGDVLPLGSNLLRLPDLMPGESAEIVFPVTVQPTASISSHPITLSINYRTLNGQQSWSEQFTMPVSQTMRLENGGVQLAPSVLQGDVVSLTLPLMNMGKGELHNVMITLNLPPITEKQSVLVGTIAPGETKQGKISFTPGKTVLGDVQGSVTVTYEDAFGNAESFVLPVSTTVEEPKAYTPAADVELEETLTILGMEWKLAAALGGCMLLVCLLVLQGVLLRGKIRKMEEDKL